MKLFWDYFKRIKFIRFIPVLILIILAILFLSLDIKEYLSFNWLKQNHNELLIYKEQNFYYFIFTYMFFYVLLVACSLPGASIATITGGFLFGPYLGTIINVISATIGALIIFIAVKLAFVDAFSNTHKDWLIKMKKGFKKNAFSYLLTLRLIPIFPFWLVNIAPAILGVRTITFINATLLGIIPGSAIYTNIGNGLDKIIENNNSINLNIILEPKFLIPLILLALLSLAPTIYKNIKRI